jgi:dTMP kinase
MAQQRGKFISFEGGEGSGKSTQVRLLADYLRAQGREVVVTREPGGEEGAEAIRSLLVTGDPHRWESVTETLLFLAARVQHVQRVIKPALARGAWVISDRFHDSTRVYQGVGRGLQREFYDRLHAQVLQDFVPDITFLLDIPVDVGLARALGRGGNETRFEQLDTAFHQRVREGFLELAAHESDRIVVIDAQQSLEQVQASLQARLSYFLSA